MWLSSVILIAACWACLWEMWDSWFILVGKKAENVQEDVRCVILPSRIVRGGKMSMISSGPGNNRQWYLFLHGKTRIYLWCNRAKKKEWSVSYMQACNAYLFIYTCGTLCTYHPAWGQAAHCFLLTTCLRWSSLSAATMGSSFCRWYEIRWLMLSNNMSLVRTCREDSKRVWE